MHEDPWQERPRHEEQLREAMRPRQVPVAHVHDHRRQTEHDEQPGARPARAQQGDQRAESEDEDPAGQVLNDVMLERAERHLAARGVFLDERAAAHEQVAHARAGRMALDLFLELARGRDDLAVDGAHEVEGLDALALDAADAHEEIFHHGEARPRAADHPPRVVGDDGHEERGEGDQQDIGRRFESSPALHRSSVPQASRRRALTCARRGDRSAPAAPFPKGCRLWPARRATPAWRSLRA